MPKVLALSSFDHGGPRRRGEEFEVSDAHATGLKRANLVHILGDGDVPPTAAGETQQSSASQAAQASKQPTAKQSARGAANKKGGGSSS
ncbi:hypothetical protein PAN31117_03110 [Pandoraea anapnoica]|uniref:Uncharacterized protein n=1 Tax=Pandoraea anapnoica TaxID=2508301 RepID=A0A5E5A735_9BURK|nr:hypothetical protein PAN31117_03110 [Pandoraea anapnoica]